MEQSRNIGKWNTVVEYYNEDGEQITAVEAKKNYTIINKIKNVKIEGNTGTIKWWYRCEKSKQLRLL